MNIIKLFKDKIEQYNNNQKQKIENQRIPNESDMLSNFIIELANSEEETKRLLGIEKSLKQEQDRISLEVAKMYDGINPITGYPMRKKM